VSDDRNVLLIGLAIDTGNPLFLEQQIVNEIARRCDHWLDYLDRLGGRFVIARVENGDLRVVQDATAMRSLFYQISGPAVVASHASLLAKIVHAQQNADFGSYLCRTRFTAWSERYLPGHMTPWDGIHPMTANMSLLLHVRQLTRVWPRGPLQLRDPSSAAEDVLRLMRAQADNLFRRGRPVAVSLTEGLDSNTTLWAIRQWWPKTEFFTYFGQSYMKPDKEGAQAIARELRLSHRLIEIAENLEPDLLSSLRINHFGQHKHGLVPAYLTTFSQKTIHIRSNVAEVGRAFYRTSHPRPEQGSDELLASFWKNDFQRKLTTREFAKWTVATDFWTAAETIDYADLFYWEHRLSCWHAGVVLESDIAFDTVSLFNCRTLLEAMLSVPLDDRLADNVQKQVVHLASSLAAEQQESAEAQKRTDALLRNLAFRTEAYRTARRRAKHVLASHGSAQSPQDSNLDQKKLEGIRRKADRT
jgi:hypothetical protein